MITEHTMQVAVEYGEDEARIDLSLTFTYDGHAAYLSATELVEGWLVDPSNDEIDALAAAYLASDIGQDRAVLRAEEDRWSDRAALRVAAE